MLKRTHILIGAAATLPLITRNNLILIPVALIGSVAPDWDLYLGIKHRTVTHSLIGLVCSSAPFLFNIQLAVLWFINYGLHLLADSVTKMGVPLLYPKRKYYGLKLIVTGRGEDLFLSLLAIYIIIMYINRF